MHCICSAHLFNVFINDIFLVIDQLYNYADDNTLSRVADNPSELKQLLDTASAKALNWFDKQRFLMQGINGKCPAQFLVGYQLGTTLTT